MNSRPAIPKPTIKRLTRYLREIERQLELGVDRLNSRKLGQAAGVADTQVRKDLACFGQFGQPGVGYSTHDLGQRLRTILGKDRTWNAAVVGAGKIGQALMGYARFRHEGFEVAAVFDNDEKVIGQKYEGHHVRPMSDLDRIVSEREILLGIVAVPEVAAQEVADKLVDAGVQGILNFSPIRLDVHQQVSVASVDFTAALEQLAFQVSLGIKGSLDEDA